MSEVPVAYLQPPPQIRFYLNNSSFDITFFIHFCEVDCCINVFVTTRYCISDRKALKSMPKECFRNMYYLDYFYMSVCVCIAYPTHHVCTLFLSDYKHRVTLYLKKLACSPSPLRFLFWKSVWTNEHLKLIPPTHLVFGFVLPPSHKQGQSR